MAFMKSKGSNVVMWIIMALLIVGLGGFGLTGAFQGSSASAVANVGDEEVTVDQFYTALQQDVRALSQRLGTTITITQALQFGVDQTTMRRLIGNAALNNESRNLGLSVGNATVQQALLENPAFQGLSGGFSEDAYDFTLTQQNLSRVEYDELVRNNLTQTLIQSSVSGVLGGNASTARTLMDYQGQTRSLSWSPMAVASLPSPAETPTDAQLTVFHTENPDLFTVPETRQITYVMLTPEMVAATIDVSEEQITEEYEARSARYNTPASRIIDRIVFGDMAEAQTAMDAIASGDSSFDEIADARGLIPQDINVGQVTLNQVSPEAREVLFAATEPGEYGPVSSNLGPAVFRINAVIAEKTTPLEDVHDAIAQEIALSGAQSTVLSAIENIADLLAGGVPLEQIAQDSDMELFTIAFNANSTDPVTRDRAFSAEALDAEVNEERDILDMANGGVFALRVDQIDPSFVQTLEETRDIAVTGWTEQRNRELMVEHATMLKALLDNGAEFSGTLDANGLFVTIANNVSRNALAPNMPIVASDGAFDLAANETAVFEDENGVYLVQVTRVDAFDPQIGENPDILSRLEGQLTNQISSDIFVYYANTLISDANPTINQALVNQILTQQGRQ